MSKRQRLCFFVDGLQYWVATELRRREPQDLASAMMIVERLGNFKQYERLRYPRHERAKGRGDGRSKSGSPKAIDDEPNGDEGRCRHYKVQVRIEGGKKDFNIIDMDELGVVLGMDFMETSSTTLNPYCVVMMMAGKEGQPKWMIPLVSKGGANARKGITVLQLDEGLKLCYIEWQMGPRIYAVDKLTKTITTEKFSIIEDIDANAYLVCTKSQDSFDSNRGEATQTENCGACGFFDQDIWDYFIDETGNGSSDNNSAHEQEDDCYNDDDDNHQDCCDNHFSGEVHGDFDYELTIGKVFVNEDDAYNFYNLYARLKGFAIRKHWATRSRTTGKLIKRQFVCNKEGFRSSKDILEGKLSVAEKQEQVVVP
ncbi:hypothetical protein RJ639_019924 [Escallonia herrerae]|uniref:FAR1 domain-containing protein n=1 Tax=Escallonia herrerae TaxID=1293975 RepID=A0AA88VA11_9ASTE|nr:hypothetical protein RJ639_019924 [Escallonia herrerae]